MADPRRGYLPTPGGEQLSVEMVEASALDAANARIATLEAALRSGLETCELAKDMTFAPWATYVKKLLDGSALRGEGEKP